MSTKLAPRSAIPFAVTGMCLIASGVRTESISAASQNTPAKAVAMQDLTVPENQLPTGCRLKVIDSSRRGPIIRMSAQPFSIAGNPWTGTDRRILATLRQHLDGYGMVRLPDGPPLTNSEASAMLLKFADGVEEGYVATYTQTDSRDLSVWAVRFTPGERDRHSSQTVRAIDIGPIRAALVGDASACSTAVETHLRSLGR